MLILNLMTFSIKHEFFYETLLKFILVIEYETSFHRPHEESKRTEKEHVVFGKPCLLLFKFFSINIY